MKFHPSWRLVLVLLVLQGFGFSAFGEDPPPKNFNIYLPAVTRLGPNDVLLNPQAIGGTGCSILYQGKTFTGPVVVPKTGLVGVLVNGKGYLYHPSMGGNITFSETTNRLAFLKFWLGSPENSLQAGAEMNQAPYAQIDLQPALGSLPNQGSLTLPTQVKIERKDPHLIITNRVGRWVAIKIHYKEWGPQVHYLAPAGRILEDNLIATLGNLKVISHPLLDDAASPCSLKISSTHVTRIETFGAVYRGISAYVLKKKWPAGSEESWNGPDHDLVLRLNLIDCMHTVLEGFEHLTKLIPVECVDLVIDLFINMIQTTFLTYATGEERIKMAYALAMTHSAMWNIFTCMSYALSGTTAEPVLTFWDLIVAGGYVIEDGILLPQYLMAASAHSSEDLYYPPCELTAATRIDAHARAKIKGPVGSEVSYFYTKRYCAGNWGSIIGPYKGTIGADGFYLAGMVGIFKLENTQDDVLIRATVNGKEKQAILNYGDFNQWEGFSLFFPKVAELVFP